MSQQDLDNLGDEMQTALGFAYAKKLNDWKNRGIPEDYRMMAALNAFDKMVLPIYPKDKP